jgi:hypothetical protein
MELKANIGHLPAKDQGFAKSLLSQLDQKGDLSPKQWHWVSKLNEAACSAPQEPEKTTTVGDFSAVIALMQGAAAKLQFPTIRLQTPDGYNIRLHVAGPQANHPGSVTVKSVDQGTWLGRIFPDGKWEMGKAAMGMQTSLLAILASLAVDPAGTAAAYGKLTGKCSFCASGLTDDRSLEVGYGPVCAKNFGLPWGAKH